MSQDFSSKLDPLTDLTRRRKLLTRRLRKKRLQKRKEDKIHHALEKLLQKIKETNRSAGPEVHISAARLTKKIGIYKQGKKSATILRDMNEEERARSEQDLPRILELIGGPRSDLQAESSSIGADCPERRTRYIEETGQSKECIPIEFSFNAVWKDLQQPLERRNRTLFKNDLQNEVKIKLLKYLFNRDGDEILPQASREGSLVFSRSSRLVSRDAPSPSPPAQLPETPSPPSLTAAPPQLVPVDQPANSPLIKWSFVPDESFLLAQGDHLWSPEKSVFTPSILEQPFSPPFPTLTDENKCIAEYYGDRQEVQKPFSLASSQSDSGESGEDSPNWSHIRLASPPTSPWRYPRRNMF